MPKVTKLAPTRDGIARIEVDGTEMHRFVDLMAILHPTLTGEERSALAGAYRKNRPGFFHRVHKNSAGMEMGYYFIARTRPQVVDYCTRTENVEEARRMNAIGIGHGAGLKKGRASAPAAAISLKLGDVELPVCPDTAEDVQAILDVVYMQHQAMQSMLRLSDEDMLNLKPRYRVKAGSAPLHLTVVPPSLAPTVNETRAAPKKRERSSERRDEMILASAPTKLWGGKKVPDYSKMTPEQSDRVRRAEYRMRTRRNRAQNKAA